MRTLLIGFITLFLITCNNPTSSFGGNTSNSSDVATDISQSESSESDKSLRKKLGLENVVIFSHVVGKNTPKGKGAEWLKQEVTKQGFLENSQLQVYPGALLFNDPEVMSPLEKNKVQLAAPSISKLISHNPKLQIFDFPFLFLDIDEVQKFYNVARDKLFYLEGGTYYLDEKRNFIVLGLWHSGMKQLSNNRDFEKGDKPLNSSKIRIQSSEIIKNTFDSLGVSESVSDDSFGTKLYYALKKSFSGQAGGIDGQENTWSSIYEENYYQVQQNFKETNHGYLGYLVITNKIFWDSLDSLDQEKWKKMVDGASLQVKSWSKKLNETAKKKIEAHVNKAERKSFAALTPEERETWCKGIYEDNFNSWKEIVTANKELIEIATKDKTGCPFDFFKRMLLTP